MELIGFHDELEGNFVQNFIQKKNFVQNKEVWNKVEEDWQGPKGEGEGLFPSSTELGRSADLNPLVFPFHEWQVAQIYFLIYRVLLLERFYIEDSIYF